MLKPMFNRRLASTFAAALIFGPSLGLAQSTNEDTNAPFKQFQNLQGTFGIQAGNYNFTSYNKGRLQDFVLHQMAEAQESDRQYVLTKTAEIEMAVNTLITQSITGDSGIQTLSDSAYANHASGDLDIGVILAAYRAYRTSYNVTLNRLATLKALPSAMPNAESVSLEGSGIVQLRTKGKVDFSEIIGFYKEQIQAIDAQVSQIRFTTDIKGKSIVQKTITEIEAEIAAHPPYSQSEINQFRDQELAERNYGRTETRAKIEAHFNMTRSLVNQYLNDYGTLQRWRKNTTPELRQKTLGELEQAFWSRSLLRALFGIPQGAIGINFNTRAFNAEYVFANNQLTFQSAPVYKQALIDSQRRQLAIALAVMEKRDQTLVTLEAPLVSTILSGITMIKGQWQLAQVNVHVLKLLYADMEEEAILATQSPNDMFAHYQSRYYTGRSDEEIAAIRARAEDWTGADSAGTDNIRGTFKIAYTEGNKYLTHLDKAEQIKAKILAFDDASAIIGKYRNRQNRL